VVLARPRTGRTHQVRRHLKHLSLPVIGDANYGKGPINRDFAARFGLARLALHAWSLTLTHPATGARVTWCAALPDDLAAPLARVATAGDTSPAWAEARSTGS
jgi:tRNA pseudouridine65 synthase